MAKIKSHVQIPAFILKQFTEENGKVWYLDLYDGAVLKQKGYRQLGIEKGAYCESTETSLSAEIEGPMGKICKKLRSFASGEIDHINDIEYMDLIGRKYIIYSIVRNDE